MKTNISNHDAIHAAFIKPQSSDVKTLVDNVREALINNAQWLTINQELSNKMFYDIVFRCCNEHQRSEAFRNLYSYPNQTVDFDEIIKRLIVAFIFE